MILSEVTESLLAEYLRLDGDATAIVQLEPLLKSAKGYIRSYTGLTDEQLDTHEDVVIAAYVLVQDMYDNRAMYVEKANVNKVVDTILNMHCVNLI